MKRAKTRLKRARLRLVRRTIRYQARIIDTRGRVIARAPMGTALGPTVEAAIAETMRRFHVSRSFVIAVAVSTFFGVDTERYDDGE